MFITATKARPLYDYDGAQNAYDFSACDEFATSPACAELVLNMFDDLPGGEGDEPVTRFAGLTVRDVLQEVAEYWASGPGARSVYMKECEHAFTGWMFPKVLKYGTVYLQAAGYDH